MTAVTCQGCEKPATDFQCPLCQAENQETQGYYCSQECFAQNWLEHRNTLHKSGIVREKKRQQAPANGSDAAVTEGPRRKRGREGAAEVKAQSRGTTAAATAPQNTTEDENEEEEDEEPPLMYLPWPPMPTPSTVAQSPKAALTTPPLDLHCPRAVVGAAAGDTPLESMWPQLVAAAHYVVATVQQAQQSTGGDTAQVLVVAGDVRSAHAFAWAARCAGLPGRLRMAVNAAQTAEDITAAAAAGTEAAQSPALLFSAQRQVIVTTSSVVRVVGGADANGGSGAAALWLSDSPHSLLVTLPDVAAAGDLQGVRTRAVFLVARHATPKSPKKKTSTPRKGNEAEAEEEEELMAAVGAAAAWAVDETITHTAVSVAELETMLPRPSPFPMYGLSLSWQPMPSLDNILDDDDDASSSASGEGSEEEAERSSAAREVAHNNNEDEQLFTVSRQQCISDKLDNDLATSLVHGDAGVVQHLIRIYSSDPGYFEEVFFNAMCCDWGALGVAHAHHRLAHVTRRLVDASGRFAAKKGATLADAALRAATRLVRLLPPLLPTPEDEDEDEEDAKNAGDDEQPSRKRSREETAANATKQQPTEKERQDYFNYYNKALPNLQLQATICHLFDVAPEATLDAFAAAWGVSLYLAGPKALHGANAARQRMVERLESRYTAKLDKSYAAYLIVLGQLLYDAVAVYSLTTAEVDARLLWSLTLAREVGPLPSFLTNCFLLQEGTPSGSAVENKRKGGPKKLSSRGTATSTTASAKQSRLEQLRVHEVRAATPADYVRLPWKAFPLTGRREREIARLQRTAVEEILMAMPRVPKPMYIGDVGNLIGKWFAFNARFDGVLGVSLSDFLSKHPAEFQVVGPLVTRRKAGMSEQVKVRFDTDGFHGGDDSDDDGEGGARSRKARDRELLTGNRTKASRKKAAEAREKELPSRARKKRVAKAFNKERFNRNYKQSDPSARVPGYVKHGPRRITGRGKKPNKRLVKRG